MRYTCVTCVRLFVYGVNFGNSASVLTCYGLDDQDSIPDRDRSFDFRRFAHTGSESHTMHTDNIVLRQDGRSRNLTNHFHLVPIIRMCVVIPPFPLLIFMACCFDKCRNSQPLSSSADDKNVCGYTSISPLNLYGLLL